MPYVGFGSISGIIHTLAKLPHFFRVLGVIAIVLSIWS
jgi:hypothetical protein